MAIIFKNKSKGGTPVAFTKPEAVPAPAEQVLAPKAVEVEAEEAEASSILSVRAAEIDKIGAVYAKMKAVDAEIKAYVKEKNKKLADLKKVYDQLAADFLAEVRDDYEELAPDETVDEFGNDFRMVVGKKGVTRKVTDNEALEALLGHDKFLELAQVKLGDIDKYLTASQADDVLTHEYTPRDISFVKRS